MMESRPLHNLDGPPVETPLSGLVLNPWDRQDISANSSFSDDQAAFLTAVALMLNHVQSTSYANGFKALWPACVL